MEFAYNIQNVLGESMIDWDSIADEHCDFLEGVLIGSDPELFIINEKTGKPVSAVGLIPGEKGKAWRDPSWQKGYGLEIDNILAEFNIPPASTRDEFVDHMEFMKDFIKNFVKAKNPDLGIAHKAAMKVPEEELQSDVAKIMGCSVDYNVYTELPNPKPCGESTNLRSSGSM